MLVDLNTIKGIIFDFDGTLYDNSKLAFNLISNRFFDVFKIKADRDTRTELAGRDFRNIDKYHDIFYKVLSAHTIYTVNYMRNWHLNVYGKHMLKVMKKYHKPYDGAIELFSILEKAGIKTAIFSDYAGIQERMKAIGFPENLSAHTYSAEDFGATKPAKRPFLEIAGYFNEEAKNILVVGDRADTDGRGADVAGMKFIRIASKYSRREGRNEKTINDALFDTLSWDDFYKTLSEFFSR